MRAAIYLRVSSEDQAVNGFGIDVQEKRTRAMAAAKGWEVVEPPFCDAGLSGTLPVAERPGIAALMEAAHADKIDAVIVYAIDRLARKTGLVLSIVDELAKAGVTIISCNESLDTSTPTGQFVLTMFAALAELERSTIVARTTAGRNERGSRDGERGGRVPFGYQRTFQDGKTVGVEIDGDASGIVQTIFDLRADGYTLTAIADKLNHDGIKTGRGHSWHASSVREVLKNCEVYSGGKRGDSDTNWPALLR